MDLHFDRPSRCAISAVQQRWLSTWLLHRAHGPLVLQGEGLGQRIRQISAVDLLPMHDSLFEGVHRAGNKSTAVTTLR